VKGLERPLAAVVLAAMIGCSGVALAGGRAGPPQATPFSWLGRAAATYASWRSGSDLVAEAARYVGEGKFTGLPGAWCADAVSFWLEATGRPPLPNRMAASALSYGPRGFGAPGELVVMRTRREYAGHVGIVERVLPDGSVEIISGNRGRRVARAIIPRGMVTAFVRVR
jgi:hypothetical protein